MKQDEKAVKSSARKQRNQNCHHNKQDHRSNQKNGKRQLEEKRKRILHWNRRLEEEETTAIKFTKVKDATDSKDSKGLWAVTTSMPSKDLWRRTKWGNWHFRQRNNNVCTEEYYGYNLATKQQQKKLHKKQSEQDKNMEESAKEGVPQQKKNYKEATKDESEEDLRRRSKKINFKHEDRRNRCVLPLRRWHICTDFTPWKPSTSWKPPTSKYGHVCNHQLPNMGIYKNIASWQIQVMWYTKTVHHGKTLHHGNPPTGI